MPKMKSSAVPESSRGSVNGRLHSGWPRRRLLGFLTAAGVGAVFSRALISLAEEQPRVTEAMIRQAEWVAGVSYTDDERKLMLNGVNELLDAFTALREVPLDNGVPPALIFEPAVLSPAPLGSREGRARPSRTEAGERPSTDEDLAFAPVSVLAPLLRTRQVSSLELTRLYLDRLERYDSDLLCVITLTEELALEQARRADRELAAGHYRGPLHGIPWGAKDLLSVPPYRTTWGATPFQEQVLPEQATVASRLAGAGAVLAAKLTVGALAWGDVWYGGKTRNPWNRERGSSGSSAGPAAATSAGLVGFSIGTETWGSIVSPCTRCGVTGLRPTFGAVSRYGTMALSWSMDKIGPVARSVEDCALVFDAIRGRDLLDPSVVERPFAWPLTGDPRAVRVGYVDELFQRDRAEGAEDELEAQRAREWQSMDNRTLEVLRRIGIDPVPVRLPGDKPVEHLSFILTAEAATAFDRFSRGALDDTLVRQVEQAWPNVFRQGQLIPAVEYLRANRIRWQLLQELEELFVDVDVYVCPTFGGHNLLLTNLTGHPCVVLPNGYRSSDGTPTSITFIGRLHGETELLAVADAYQQATDYHLRRPPVGS
jgi:Asp-tRNA(Asn)/Glu-tRNA(Gln) amidotransferase A subunit family amidase